MVTSRIDTVCVEFSSAKRRMPSALQERLSSRQRQTRDEAYSREHADKVRDRLQAAEERRKGRLEKVKQKAIDTRPIIFSWGLNSSSSIIDSAGMSSDQSCGHSTEGVTVSPPIELLSANTSFAPSELDSAVFCHKNSSDFWQLVGTLHPMHWEPALLEVSSNIQIVPLSPSDVSSILDGDIDALRHLVTEINNRIQLVGDRCCIKLSSQSRAEHNQVVMSACNTLLSSYLSDGISVDMGREHATNCNAEAVAVLKAIQEGQVVSSGEDGLRRIITSARSGDHIKNATEVLSVLVSGFKKCIQPETEWRCFIHNREVTAITQYHHLCYFPGIENPRLQILQFLLPLLSHLPTDSCVVDICIPTDGSDPFLMDLSPFHCSTDGFLYDWSAPSDFETLTSGFADLRMRNEPSSSSLESVTQPHKDVIDSWWSSCLE
eukprot:TRINITY_DN18358_c0_g1_i1.p1 TRINITY_DN18358_c0_g1~~TRINITY_DN18358_c0_g1_i1.p1  ORF type:complete len:434 (+),score=80.84 TRINITY_DN18358_c0_g1_i1:59-1360(+)